MHSAVRWKGRKKDIEGSSLGKVFEIVFEIAFEHGAETALLRR
jgi:hypothetical protein